MSTHPYSTSPYQSTHLHEVGTEGSQRPLVAALLSPDHGLSDLVLYGLQVSSPGVVLRDGSEPTHDVTVAGAAARFAALRCIVDLGVWICAAVLPFDTSVLVPRRCAGRHAADMRCKRVLSTYLACLHSAP
jgi:hypothetical protein